MVSTDTYGNGYNHGCNDTYPRYEYHSVSISCLSVDTYPWKIMFWRWLRSFHPEIITVLRRFKTVILWNKRYITRMMFCKSGYLGNRIRKIKKSK